jgi:hypothetical protein
MFLDKIITSISREAIEKITFKVVTDYTVYIDGKGFKETVIMWEVDTTNHKGLTVDKLTGSEGYSLIQVFKTLGIPTGSWNGDLAYIEMTPENIMKIENSVVIGLDNNIKINTNALYAMQ